MIAFTTSRDAKQFLVDTIVTQAQREQIALSEVEMRMLYFTETAWMPFGFKEVNEAFERECDITTYEPKIAGLIRSFKRWAVTSDKPALKRWIDAVEILR